VEMHGETVELEDERGAAATERPDVRADLISQDTGAAEAGGRTVRQPRGPESGGGGA
jgi:hypothetical protein